MEKRKQQGPDDDRQRDELKLPEERVEDLEPDESQSDDVTGGNFTKIEVDR